MFLHLISDNLLFSCVEPVAQLLEFICLSPKVESFNRGRGGG